MNKIVVTNPEGKRPHGKPRHRWDCIKMDSLKLGYNGMDEIYLAQDSDHWWTLVVVVMTSEFRKKWGVSWPADLQS